MRFCVGLLILSLLSPPVTVASAMIACLDADKDMGPMASQTMDPPMDEVHACCTTMPEENEACDHPATTMTCCPEVQVARHQNHTRSLPLSRYEAHISLDMAIPFPIAAPIDLAPPLHFLAHTTSYLDDESPPIRTLFCIYLI